MFYQSQAAILSAFIFWHWSSGISAHKDTLTHFHIISFFFFFNLFLGRIFQRTPYHQYYHMVLFYLIVALHKKTGDRSCFLQSHSCIVSCITGKSSYYNMIFFWFCILDMYFRFILSSFICMSWNNLMSAIYIRVTNLMKISLTVPRFLKPYGKISLHVHTCSFGEDKQT